MMLRVITFGVLLSVVFMAGCTTMSRGLDRVLPDRRTEYQRAESLPDLEVPPELSVDAIQDRMAIPQADAASSYATFQERATGTPSSAPMAAADTSRPRQIAPLQTAQAQRAEMISAGEGKVYIRMHEQLGSAWPRIASALGEEQRIAVEEANPDRGTFTVRYSDIEAVPEEKGFLSRLAFWRKDNPSTVYLISLTGVGDDTEVVILDEDAVWDTSTAAGEILAGLYTRLQ